MFREAIDMGPLGPTELIIILAIILLLFGSRKLPDLARSLGKSQREFKKGLQEKEAEEAPEDTSSAKKPEETGGSAGPS